jgi:Flp pilus assembly pilin Flp
MTVMSRCLFLRFLIDERGQDLIEYALLAGFISLTSTAFISVVGEQVNTWYEGYGVTISTIPSGSGS